MYQAKKERYQTMQYRHCGHSGLQLPLVSLGLWHNFGDTGQYEVMKELCHTAFDQGVTHFDLANNYGPLAGSAERNFGRILREEFSGYRDELIISTKAGYEMWEGPYGNWGSRKHILASIEQSLERLGIPYVDIFYHHRMDANTPLEETMEALAHIVRQGKALYIGLSNYDGDTLYQASKLLSDLHVPYIINQNRYNMLDRTIEQNWILDRVSELEKGLIVFSPLAQGQLSDRYLLGIPNDSRIVRDGRYLHADMLNEEKRKCLNALQEIATTRCETLATMALAWVLQKPAVTSVLIGASKPSQIMDNIKVLQSPDFTKEQLETIDAILQPLLP